MTDSAYEFVNDPVNRYLMKGRYGNRVWQAGAGGWYAVTNEAETFLVSAGTMKEAVELAALTEAQLRRRS